MTATVVTGIEWGYARVSTKKQDLHRQIHALTTYGIPADPATGDGRRLYVDKLTGKNLNRQGWQELRPRLRAGDVLVLAELDRLGRSQTEMLHLFTELTDAGIHVNVIGGPIPFDTRSPGPATEMAKALLLFLGQVELIYKQERVASARESGKNAHRPRKLTPQLEEDLAGEFSAGTLVDELAAKYGVSRATVYRIAREHQVRNNARRTFTPTGRGKSMTPAQIGTAHRLKADGLSIRQIAASVGASRATVHRTLAATSLTEITTGLAAALSTSAPTSPAGPQRLACPGCGTVPNGKTVAARLREELQTEWWSTSANGDRIQVTRHCGRCQPHTVYAVACLACGDGPLLTGELADVARDTDPQELPEVVVSELIRTGRCWTETSYGNGWVCCRPATKTAASAAAVGGLR
ncbi:recombinase family protein [Kribbella sp. NPDC058245]|uniref:recombinase family protein n=1 Tax=Kribbella sp. NPDC058245 TaxID=3346399 RepID=UPI0036E4D992